MTHTYGSIGSHTIVLPCLPLGRIGTTSASRVANLLPTNFADMRPTLFVGVSGGIPHHPPNPDASQVVHLGDAFIGVDQTLGVAVLSSRISSETKEMG